MWCSVCTRVSAGFNKLGPYWDHNECNLVLTRTAGVDVVSAEWVTLKMDFSDTPDVNEELNWVMADFCSWVFIAALCFSDLPPPDATLVPFITSVHDLSGSASNALFSTSFNQALNVPHIPFKVEHSDYLIFKGPTDTLLHKYLFDNLSSSYSIFSWLYIAIK